MDERTLKALRASIKHWERNVEAEMPRNASVGASHCALCAVFSPGRTDQCNGCPVVSATGQIGCYDTPYDAAHMAFIRWRESPSSEALRTAWREAAQAQLDFLRSLLPKEDGQ